MNSILYYWAHKTIELNIKSSKVKTKLEISVARDRAQLDSNGLALNDLKPSEQTYIITMLLITNPTMLAPCLCINY